jgi:hypothetical protein
MQGPWRIRQIGQLTGWPQSWPHYMFLKTIPLLARVAKREWNSVQISLYINKHNDLVDLERNGSAAAWSTTSLCGLDPVKRMTTPPPFLSILYNLVQLQPSWTDIFRSRARKLENWRNYYIFPRRWTKKRRPYCLEHAPALGVYYSTGHLLWCSRNSVRHPPPPPRVITMALHCTSAQCPAPTPKIQYPIHFVNTRTFPRATYRTLAPLPPSSSATVCTSISLSHFSQRCCTVQYLCPPPSPPPF